MEVVGKPYRWHQRERLRQYTFQYFSEHPCVDCGEDRVACLQFDHVDGKSANISKMVHNRVGLMTLIAEIERCVVRCANCHAVKTASDFDWYRRLENVGTVVDDTGDSSSPFHYRGGLCWFRNSSGDFGGSSCGSTE